MEAKSRKNDSGFYAALSALDLEFEKAYHDYAAWNEIREDLEVRRKMVDSEVKTIKEIKAMLTAEQAHKLIENVMQICIETVKEPRTLRRISYRLSRLIGENSLQPAGGSGEDVLDLEAEED